MIQADRVVADHHPGKADATGHRGSDFRAEGNCVVEAPMTPEVPDRREPLDNGCLHWSRRACGQDNEKEHTHLSECTLTSRAFLES